MLRTAELLVIDRVVVVSGLAEPDAACNSSFAKSNSIAADLASGITFYQFSESNLSI